MNHPLEKKPEKTEDEASRAILLADAHGEILSVNRPFCTLTGLEPPQITGRPLTVFRTRTDGPLLFAAVRDTLENEGVWKGVVVADFNGGPSRELSMTLHAVTDAAGTVRHCIGIFSDTAEKNISLQQLQQLAYYDVLTGLPNRVLFFEHFEHALALASRENKPLALLYLDLDDFKSVNDTFGHDFGDALLREITKRIRHTVRKSDTVGRLGGDEFIILMERMASRKDADTLARRLIAAISEPVMIEGQVLYTSASVGISLYPQDGENTRKLTMNADRAMYEAKESGKDQFGFYKNKNYTEYLHSARLLNDMPRALESNEFHLLYQPQYDIARQRFSGAEILIRWRHPEFGTVSPLQFIPLAEMNGLITPITERIIIEASKNFRALDEKGLHDFTLSVNLSPRMLFRGDFNATISFFLDTYYLPEGRFTMEITENTFMKKMSDLIAKLDYLRSRGVRIEIDDYGTGYTSLNYLINLPVDTIKIDRAFVTGIDRNEKSRAILAAMVMMARNLDLDVIAEGAEMAGEVRELEALGCQKIQGFYYSEPVTFDTMLEKIYSRG